MRKPKPWKSWIGVVSSKDHFWDSEGKYIHLFRTKEAALEWYQRVQHVLITPIATIKKRAKNEKT